MKKQNISIRLTQTAMDIINSEMEKTKSDRTRTIEKIIILQKEYKKGIFFLFNLFQQNAEKLDISEEQIIQAKDILELLHKSK